MNNKIINNTPLLVEYNLNSSSKKQIASTEVVKNRLKQEIQQAFTRGDLGFRVISIEKEVQYLQKKDKDPRPICLIAPEIPMSMRAHSEEDASDEHIIGITNIKTLFSYKANSYTYILASQKDPNITKNDRYIKAHADTNSLLTKLYELSDRIWEVYPISTSGHLTKDGTYSLPKFSNKIISNYLDYSELVMINYKKQQIKCYCISETNSRGIVGIIARKHKLEAGLGIENLPLVIYSEKSGSIKIFFEEDLDLKKLTENEDKITNIQAISGIFLKKKLAPIVSISSQINILGNSIINIEAPDIKNATNQLELRSKLITLIENYNQYSIEDFQELINKGVNVKLEIYEGSLQLYLVDKLLSKIKHTITFIQDEVQFTKGLVLLIELFKLGAPCSGKYLDSLFFCEDKMQANYQQILKIYAAANIASDNVSLPYLSPLKLLVNEFSTDDIATIVILDKILQDRTTSINQIFISLIDKIVNLHIDLILEQPTKKADYSITSFQLQFIVMFSYGVNPYLIQETILKTINSFKEYLSTFLLKLYGENPEQQVLQYILTLYDNYKINPVYIDWISKLTFAKQEITTLKQDLGINNTYAINSNQNENSLAKFFSTLLNTPLVFNQVANDNQTISAILQQYYRRPGPLQAVKNINNIDWPLIWKSIHSSSHVLRAYNNANWYMQLLEKFNLINLTDEEKLLLQLAVVYHDAAAEDVSKKQEEQKSAYYFTRDLTGKFSAKILEKIALALEAKENDIQGIEPQHNDADIDKYTRIIRFADRMDFTRCSTIDANFPDFTATNIDEHFNVELLNIPASELTQFTSVDANKTEFQRYLEAAMHGAVDLATVAGGYNGRDLRSKGDYKKRYSLNIENQRLKIAFEQTDKPVSQLGILLDNNVRRKIAQLANIHTCNDPNHKVCKADIHEGVMYGIHSTSNDLSQVNIPETMTLLEKMQIEHDYSLLSKATQNAITLEINRLQTEGIKMSLGTLTQETLKSDAARATLKTRGITVISEIRARGFNSLQEQKYHEMLVPQKICNSSD